MSLKLNTRKVQGVVIIDMAGRLEVGEPVSLLRSTIRHYVDDGNLKFVLSMGEVSYIDSSGLGELTAAYSSIRKRGGDVALLQLTRTAKDLLQMTKLLTVFDTYEDETKAVQAVGGGASAATS